MDEVGAALVAIALVLCAVFVPSAFITGISGQFYRQFALTIAGATVISLIVSLTLSPALCALLLKPHDHGTPRPLVGEADRGAFGLFNRGFDRCDQRLWLARGPRRALSRASCWSFTSASSQLAANVFSQAPSGFIPQQDRGYLIVVAQLPPGASLSRAPTR